MDSLNVTLPRKLSISARERARQLSLFLADGGDPWTFEGPLTDALVAALPPPPTGNRLKFDTQLRGFAVRVTAAGARSFVLNYISAKRERRITIGGYPAWSTAQARDAAAALRRRVDSGEDPMQERHVARAVPLMKELIERFNAEHVVRLRPSSQRLYRESLRLHATPVLGQMQVTAVTREDVARLHRGVGARAPFTANHTVGILRVLFNRAMEWGLRDDNPAAGIEFYPEPPRERFLIPSEIIRLNGVMDAWPEGQSSGLNALRLLMLTGARVGELLRATWNQFDLERGVWTKPAASTKTKKIHRVPLSPPALTLLAEMRRTAAGPLVFPGTAYGGGSGSRVQPHAAGIVPRSGVWYTWRLVRRAAGLEDVRIHDLRHSYASVLAANGVSLQVIGALLGHSRITTTQRYSHLLDENLRAATDLAGRTIAGDTK